MKQIKLSDKDIVKGIEQHDSAALRYVYKEFYPYVENYVKHHGGTKEQAKDLFQEAMIIVYKKIESGNFSLFCKFGTYLYAVCKRLWIQEKKKYMLQVQKLKQLNSVSEPEEEYSTETMEKARELFERHFNKLSPDCQKILSLSFSGMKAEEIQKLLKIDTVHHLSDKKYRCKKSLVSRIRKDPIFRKISNG